MRSVQHGSERSQTEENTVQRTRFMQHQYYFQLAWTLVQLSMWENLIPVTCAVSHSQICTIIPSPQAKSFVLFWLLHHVVMRRRYSAEYVYKEQNQPLQQLSGFALLMHQKLLLASQYKCLHKLFAHKENLS